MNIEAWHFLPNDRRLRFGSREIVYPGRKLTIEGHPRLCRHGMHSSRRLIDALNYAHGTLLCRVAASGEIIEDDDKLVSTERTVMWMADATEMLIQFACLQALSVSHLWDMPQAVRQYLQTQNPRQRAAAWAADWAAARDAARAAAWDAARAAAWDAARAAAWDAARAAARDADRDAAMAAAWDAADAQLTRLAWMLCGPETAQFPERAA